MKRLFSYLGRYKKESILAPLFKMLEASFELLVPLVVASVVDKGIAFGDSNYIVRMVLLLVALGLVGFISSVTAQYFAAKSAIGAACSIRSDLFAHIFTLSHGELDTIGTSTLVNRMTSDINQVQNGVNMALRLLLRSPFLVFGAVAMAFTVDVKTATVFAVAVPVLCVVVFFILLTSMPMYKTVQKQLDRVTLATRENLSGVRVVRAFGKECEEQESFAEDNSLLLNLQVKVGKISALLNPLTYVLINIALVVVIYVGAGRVDAGVISKGAVIALINYMSQILFELIRMANLLILISKAVASMHRIDAVFKIEPSITSTETGEQQQDSAGAAECDSCKSTVADTTDGRAQVAATDAAGQGDVQHGAHNSARLQDASAEAQGEPQQNMPLRTSCAAGAQGDHPGTPRVEFRDVSFAYPSASKDSLEHISFYALPGETVGLIGGTGAGKSTIINLIPRFYDAGSGAVLVDGNDVKTLPLERLRACIGVVPQRALLFKGTLRDNMMVGNTAASDEDIYGALATAQALEFVEQKGEGLELPIETGGKNLSGGQRQRLTIARALVRHPGILILDDSASALDYATDARLRAAIKQDTSGMTVFIVSQRASSIRNADKIIAIDDGKIAGIGTHRELLLGCPLYREICLSQLSKEEVERDEK